jgi:hypothetical protein
MFDFFVIPALVFYSIIVATHFVRLQTDVQLLGLVQVLLIKIQIACKER